MFLTSRHAGGAAVGAALRASARPKTDAGRPTLPDAREIIDRHIKAIGGREAILAHKSMHATGTLSVPGAGHHRADGDLRRRPNPNRVARQDRR